MKKIYTLFALAAITMASCTTKQDLEPAKTQPEIGKVTLHATMPAFTSTKAEVADDGIFSWSANDEIAVEYSDGTNSQYITFTCSDAANGTFTNKDEIPAGYSLATDGIVAYYPVSYRGTVENQAFESLDAAKKGFQMSATLEGGNLKFAHDNALLKVTVNNIPSFAKKLSVGGVNITLDATGDVIAYVPLAPAAAAKMTVAVTEGENTIISKTTGNAVAIEAANLYPLKALEIGPVVDLLNYASSWDAAYIYLFSDSSAYDTEWANLSTVMKKYNDGTYDHYYRILPSGALGKTYDAIVFNSSDDQYRIRTRLTIEQETQYSVSIKEGLRKIGDQSHRLIIRDEALGTDKDSNPDTYLYIKSITGVDGTGFTGSWESDDTKAIGWFIGKRNGSASGRYFYFNTDELKNYLGYWFVFEYTMYKEDDHSDQWRASYNNDLSLGYQNYLHLGCYYDGSDWKFYNDTDFDSQMSE